MNTEKINSSVFLKVAETGSFRKAAEALGYTQAGISYIISAMESETGLTLFLREHGGVRLSPEGEALIPYMKEQESWARRLCTAIDELHGLEQGQLRIQIFDSISIHWIPGIIKRFRSDFPGIGIELISAESEAQARQMIETGEVDCGFFMFHPEGDLEGYPLLTEGLMACVSLSHPLAGASCFPLKDLGKYPFIGMRYDDHTGVKEIFSSRHIRPDVAFYVDNDYASMAMVSQDLGYGIYPQLLLQDVPYALHCMEFDTPQKRTIYIGTKSMAARSRACTKFMEYARKWVEENS